MGEPALRLRGVRKYFGSVSALEDVHLDAYPGEVLAVVGDNGAGKSTMIKIITGIHRADEGEVLVNGEHLDHVRSSADAQAHGIAVVYQDLALVECLDIAHNMALGNLPRKYGIVLDRRRMEREAGKVLKDLKVRVGNVRTPVGLLSGGQRQVVAADVIGWLDARPQDQPFFLYVHTVDPHVPYMPPADMLALYDPDPYEGPVDFNRDRELLEHVKSGSQALTERDRVRLEALYDGEITYHDAHFGSIIEALERRGVADETIVIFTADHGEEFWDHGSVGHGHSVYEELINVPLIVRIPGVTDGGVRLEDSVGLVDVLPTIYDAMGRDIPDDLSGESFLPLLLGETADAPRVAVTGFMEGWRAVNVGRLKLIQRTERRVMLHDLVEDPDEVTDVASERPIAVRYARGLLGLHLAGTERPSRRRAAIRQQRIEIDAETQAQLEALGYVGGSRAGVAQPESEE